MFKLFKMPEPPELDKALMESLYRQEFKTKAFLALCAGGSIHLFNQPDTVDEWLDRMYDQLHGAGE